MSLTFLPFGKYYQELHLNDRDRYFELLHVKLFDCENTRKSSQIFIDDIYVLFSLFFILWMLRSHSLHKGDFLLDHRLVTRILFHWDPVELV